MSEPVPSKPPYRAEHVGNLLRPKELLDARYAEGKATPPKDHIHKLEDRSIPDAIALQEKIGLQSITDGEFRRASFRSPIVDRVDGFKTVPQDPIWAARDETGHSHPLGDAPLAIAKLIRNRGIATHEFDFISSGSTRRRNSSPWTGSASARNAALPAATRATRLPLTIRLPNHPCSWISPPRCGAVFCRRGTRAG